MSATRTWIPPLPDAYVAAWREAYLRHCNASSPMLGGGGGVLEQLQADSGVDERVLRFGPTWHWWRMTPELKAYWEAQG